MVVFKITNNISGKHYIGTSFNSGFQRFEQYVEATNEGLDFPLYNDIRKSGVEAFVVEELFETSDKQELYELETDYISIYNGESLRGYKIAQTAEKSLNMNFGKKALFDANGVSTAEQPKKTRKAAVKKTVELPKKAVESAPTAKSFFGELISEERLDTPAEKTVSEKSQQLAQKAKPAFKKCSTKPREHQEKNEKKN